MKERGIEKRLYPRKLMRTKVVFEDEFGDGLIYVYTENISMGGVFVSSDIPIRVGSYVFLWFCLPDSKIEIRATGQIVRVARKKGKTAKENEREGFGVRFVGLSSASAEAIKEFVS